MRNRNIIIENCTVRKLTVQERALLEREMAKRFGIRLSMKWCIKHFPYSVMPMEWLCSKCRYNKDTK